jgi:hypothetical protein
MVTSGKISVFICCVLVAASKDISFHVTLDGKDWVSQVIFHSMNRYSPKLRVLKEEATFRVGVKCMAFIEICP